MNKFFSLIRAALSEGMNIFTYHAKDKKSQRVLPLLLASLVFLSLFASAITMMDDMKESGTEYAVLAIFTLATTVLTVMEGIYKSGSLLFNCHDNDMLLAMPIKRSTITFIRIFKFYIFELIYGSIFLGPAVLAYLFHADINSTYPLVAVIMLLLLPIIPIAAACLIGAFTSAFSARFHHKNIVQIILSFAFLAATVILAFSAGGIMENIGHMSGEISDRITRAYYPAAAFVNLATNFSILELVKFILINLAVLAVTVATIGKFYFRIVSRISIIKWGKTKITRLRFTRLSQTHAMIRKEIIKYFNTPVLLINTALGIVLFLVGVIVVCFKFDDLATSLVSSAEDFPFTVEDLRAYLPGITFAMVTFSSLMTFITTTSISLEGKAFNMLKTMPISGKKVMYCKILAAMLLITPPVALGGIIMAIRFQFDIISLILILAAAVIVPLVTETTGILIDLKYARFNAENDAETVKQSPGVMVSSFLGLGSTVFTISIIFAMVMLLGQTLGLAITNVVFLAIFLVLRFKLNEKADQKYLQLTA